MTFFTETEKSVLKFIWKSKKTQIVKSVLTRKVTVEVSQYLTSNYTAEPRVIRTAWYWQKANMKTNGTE
jgi:hypothetical protein